MLSKRLYFYNHATPVTERLCEVGCKNLSKRKKTPANAGAAKESCGLIYFYQAPSMKF
jgi:hypothetical protein